MRVRRQSPARRPVAASAKTTARALFAGQRGGLIKHLTCLAPEEHTITYTLITRAMPAVMPAVLSRVPSARDMGVPRERSTDYAYRTLKARILDSDFAPGAFFLEKDAAAQLGLSRTPVREALVRLEHEGLLKIVPRHGARISALSPADMREIYEVLTSLEPSAAELLARRRPRR